MARRAKGALSRCRYKASGGNPSSTPVVYAMSTFRKPFRRPAAAAPALAWRLKPD
jgi:hypothetical protein